MDKIIFANKEFDAQVGTQKYLQRDCYRFDIVAPYEDIVKYFVDGASYRWTRNSVYKDEAGVEQVEVIDKDLSEFNIASDIIVSADRKSFKIYMGKKTEVEMLQEQLAQEVALRQAKEAETVELKKK